MFNLLNWDFFPTFWGFSISVASILLEMSVANTLSEASCYKYMHV